jgi:hypothetical protein
LLKLREKTDEEIFSELTPFGFLDDGMDAVNEDTLVIEDDRSWLMR